LYGSEILSKNWDIWNPKFQQNSIVYYFFFNFLAFLAYWLLFHVPKLVQKLWNFLWCFIGRVRDFTNNFWKFLKVLLKKILMWNMFFVKILRFTICFFIFYYFWHFIFNFVYMYLSKNGRNFYAFLFYGLEILSKNFEKSWNILKKKYKHLKSKIVHKFHRLLFVFFPISPIQTCQKILNIFVVLYCTDYRIYQRILENSWIFIKKNRDTLNTKNFKNSIVYYLLF